MAAAAGRTTENREWATDMVIRKMIEQSTSNVYRLARGCAELIDYYPSTDPMQGPIVHQPTGRMWETSWLIGLG